ncbi:hypothetical protein AVEN_231578-1 [Araneus ventricosus]|uniref:Uncharacterized protein n=1 Tax=Araneus ventricosus TaxID=182803 RepID=A0A4Y2IKK9_ARAVE|nr:hypothetical protein AVEN_231578-1 [Araneus ventricosus]
MLEKEEDRARHDSCYKEDKRMRDVLKWCSKVFDYNARTGKKSRTAALLKAYCTYGYSMDDSTWNHWDSDNWRSAVLLAWCVELVRSCLVLVIINGNNK